MPDADVAIVGGGLAGLCSGIDLAKRGKSVVIFESHPYPRHKVCGEYLSREVLPYLERIGVSLLLQPHTNIAKVEISNASGKTISARLPLGGIGISRFALDHYLAETAKAAGCVIKFETVSDIVFDTEFHVKTDIAAYSSKIVIGSFGKRSLLDQKLERESAKSKSPWLAAKVHLSGDFPDDLVGLHHFEGGYCGISKVENGAINLCWLSDYKSFRRFRGIDEFHENVLMQNPHLKKVFESSRMNFKPITIGQVSFARKDIVKNHILMLGDSAAMIHPLCGNGMAMAIISARMACAQIADFLDDKISRTQMEQHYELQWRKEFAARLATGQILSRAFQSSRWSAALLKILSLYPGILPWIIAGTHGKFSE